MKHIYESFFFQSKIDGTIFLLCIDVKVKQKVPTVDDSPLEQVFFRCILVIVSAVIDLLKIGLCRSNSPLFILSIFVRRLAESMTFHSLTTITIHQI